MKNEIPTLPTSQTEPADLSFTDCSHCLIFTITRFLINDRDLCVLSYPRRQGQPGNANVSSTLTCPVGRRLYGCFPVIQKQCFRDALLAGARSEMG